MRKAAADRDTSHQERFLCHDSVTAVHGMSICEAACVCCRVCHRRDKFDAGFSEEFLSTAEGDNVPPHFSFAAAKMFFRCRARRSRRRTARRRTPMPVVVANSPVRPRRALHRSNARRGPRETTVAAGGRILYNLRII
jgi:hypothetical protein